MEPEEHHEDEDAITVDFGESSVAGEVDEEDLYEAHRDDGTEMLNQKRDKVACFGKFEDGVNFSEFVKGDFIGEGSFGKVFECTYFGFKVAMKDYAKAGGHVAITRDALSELTQQSSWHYNLKCAFVQTLIAVNVDESLGPFCSIFPRASCSMFDLLHNPNLGEISETVNPGEHSGNRGPDPALLRKLPLSMKQRLVWLRQISLGLAAIHEKGATHLGLSSRNILLLSEYDEPTSDDPSSASRNLKFAGKRGIIAQISDFGVRRLKKQALKNNSGGEFKSASGKLLELDELAIPWMSPEMIEGGAGMQASDVFSFHVLMFEIITGSPPHIDKEFQEVINFTNAKMRLELPSDEELDHRWEEILSRQSRRSHGHVATAADHDVIASDRIAHKPLPKGLRQLFDKCSAQNPVARPTFIEISDALAKMLVKLEKEVQLEPVILESTLKATQEAEKNNAIMRSNPQRHRPSMSLAKGLDTKLLDKEDDTEGGAAEGEITLEEMCSVPVVFVNAESGRKLFAQEVNKGWDLMGNAFARGFGAGPEAHTFDDNK
jgi:serine/threonine protein kinase